MHYGIMHVFKLILHIRYKSINDQLSYFYLNTTLKVSHIHYILYTRLI